MSDVASDRRPNIIPEYMDTFAFGSGLSAGVQANPQLETVGKVTFFFFLIWNNSFSFQQKYPPVSRGGELLSLAVLDVDMLSLEVFPTRSKTELRRDVLKRDRERRATKQTLQSAVTSALLARCLSV